MNEENIVKDEKFCGFADFYSQYSVLKKVKVQKTKDIHNKPFQSEDAEVALEVTISLIINKSYRLNLLCSPDQLESLSVGYLLCEGLISSFDDILMVEYKGDNKIWIETATSNQNFFQWTEIRTSGCVGIKQQYDDIDINIDSSIKIKPDLVFKCLDELYKNGTQWKISGGLHMSGLFDKSGKMLSFSEDVGRHNTLDKIVGAAITSGIDLSQVFAITSGRLSAAMVSKVARAGIPIFISRGAPMAQGLKLAEKVKMTLIGFARNPEMNIYTHSNRIEIDQ